MKLKKLIAAAVIASCASSVFAAQPEDLTNSSGSLVKNASGECVWVKRNKGLVNCGAVEKVMQHQQISLSADAYFDFDKAVLKPQGQQAIKDLADKLNARGADVKQITVVGNTDSIGSNAYNQKLSERRAAAVANFMIANGVPASLIKAYGDGENNPVASNATAEGRAQNRRVDITIDGLVQKTVTQ